MTDTTSRRRFIGLVASTAAVPLLDLPETFASPGLLPQIPMSKIDYVLTRELGARRLSDDPYFAAKAATALAELFRLSSTTSSDPADIQNRLIAARRIVTDNLPYAPDTFQNLALFLSVDSAQVAPALPSQCVFKGNGNLRGHNCWPGRHGVRSVGSDVWPIPWVY